MDQLEPEYKDTYTAWQKQPGPESNAAMLDALAPTIEGAIRTHVGAPNPLLVGRARRMTLQGLPGYDPKRGRLRTYLYSHLQGLKRVAAQQSQTVRVPQRVAMERAHLDRTTDELTHELGREPSDDEISDHTGIPHERLARVRSYLPGVTEGTLERSALARGGDEGVVGGGAAAAGQHDAWRDLIYGDLDPYHQKVMELTMGMHGNHVTPNHEVAQRLRRSPGAISQAKRRIQQALDQETELSPFL